MRLLSGFNTLCFGESFCTVVSFVEEIKDKKAKR